MFCTYFILYMFAFIYNIILFSWGLLTPQPPLAAAFSTNYDVMICCEIYLPGVNLSGALYATFYCYELIRDELFPFSFSSFTSSSSKKTPNCKHDDRKKLREREGNNLEFSSSNSQGPSHEASTPSSGEWLTTSGSSLEFESSQGRGSSFMVPLSSGVTSAGY